MITTVDLGDYTTDIYFSELKKENNYENRLLISDEHIYRANKSFARYWDALPENHRLLLPAGESAKNSASLFRILDAAFDAELDRGGEMTAVGGGVLTDMTGLAASLFKRGCAAVFYPTTLLAMVDAAVGGKTGIDYRGMKNMIGTFYPAREVRIDLSFLETLPENEYRSGLGEVIKTAMLGDASLFRLLREESAAFCRRDPEKLRYAVARCVCIKARFVRDDFREHGIRAFLNWGHTFGHAFEAAAGLGTFTHGEAVIWGIDKGLKAAELLGKDNRSYADDFRELTRRYGFRTEAPVSDFSLFLKALAGDKKKNGGALEFVLQSGPCETFRAPLSDEILRKIIPTV